MMRFSGWIGVLLCWCVGGIASADDVKQIEMTCADIVYEPLSRRIYASVPANARNWQNSLAIIDPFNGRVESSVFAGNNPGQIAASDRGKYLWIAQEGNVRRYDIAAKQTGPMTYLGDRILVSEMHPVPGNPEALLVVRATNAGSPRGAGMVFLENGISRPAVLTDENTRRRFDRYTYTFAWGGVGNRAYCYNQEVSSFDFGVMELTAEGLKLLSLQRGVLSGYNKRLRSENGLLYFGAQAFDPETRTILGTFQPSSEVSVPDAATGRMYFAFSEKGVVRLVACDLNTFAQIDSLTISGLRGAPTRLIRWGDNGLAFTTSEGQVALVRTGLVPPPLPMVDLNLHRAMPALPLKAGKPATYTLTVRNLSPNKARGVSLSDRLPGEVDVLDIKTSQGHITAVNGVVRATLGDLLPQKTVTIRVTIQARQELTGAFEPMAFVRSLQRDKNPYDNATRTPLRSVVAPQPTATVENPQTPPNTPPATPSEGSQPTPAAVPGPDLTGTWKAVEQETQGAGVDLQATLKGTLIVRNAGRKPASECKVRLFLNSPDHDAEELLQENRLPALAPGQSVVIRLKARLKKGQSTLNQTVSAVIDPLNKVKDANRENNRVHSKPIL